MDGNIVSLQEQKSNKYANIKNKRKKVIKHENIKIYLIIIDI